jgi:hydroxymethylpyrimidine pyrophosphatase-like HAD family hydrolase
MWWGKGMRYLAVAVDYDGTLAHDGVVDEPTLAALARVRQSGRKLLMVTGREMNDLLAAFPRTDLFDRIVAENGALLYRPSSKEFQLFAPPPPQRLLEALRRHHVPFAVERCIVATHTPHEVGVLEAIREVGLEWHVIFNKGGVMAMPANITKATGLAAALKELQLRPEQVIGFGDAENDHAFLRLCGVSVAVANALPELKARADIVTHGARGAGVTEVIETLLLPRDMEGVNVRPDEHEPRLVQ